MPFHNEDIDKDLQLRVLEHLHTGEPPPPEYTDVLLMREFGWTPGQVRDLSHDDRRMILTCLATETKYDNYKRRMQIREISLDNRSGYIAVASRNWFDKEPSNALR